MIYKNKLVWILSFLLFVIDLLYPLTITYDTGHYFAYVPILRGTIGFENWDPVRGLVFPVYLFIVEVLFGKGLNGLLICMSLIHVLNFWLVLGLVVRIDKFWHKLIGRNFIIVITWLFIALDPLVVGYSHAVLTESLSLLIVLITCWTCYYLYNKAITTNQVNIRGYLALSLLTVIAYHLKQPYVGSAIFPTIIVSLLLLFHVPLRQKGRIILGNLIIAAVLGISIIVWESFLSTQEMVSNQERHIGNYINVAISKNIDLLQTSVGDFISNGISNYLALANVYSFNEQNNEIVKEVSLLRANENYLNGYRIFQYSFSNMSIPPNYPYSHYVEQYSTFYFPPKYINSIFIWMIPKSNFCFSFLYLILPLTLIYLFISMINKWDQACFFMIVLFSGSAFLNALLHTFMIYPIDRYLFYGYPLLLTSILILPNNFLKDNNSSFNLLPSDSERVVNPTPPIIFQR